MCSFHIQLELKYTLIQYLQYQLRMEHLDIALRNEKLGEIADGDTYAENDARNTPVNVNERRSLITGDHCITIVSRCNVFVFQAQRLSQRWKDHIY